jgi:riboflavin kinase/FMN adenylyltransferase
VVEHGAARGRELGFPTANIAAPGQMLPGPGVYAGRLTVRGPAGGTHAAAVAIGSPPTFPGEPNRVEAYLLDFSGDIYGAAVRLELIDRVRGLVKFAGPEELTRQIADDVRRVRERLKT